MRGTRKLKRYTVYNNKTDFPVIVNGTHRECAEAMGISLDTFYKYTSTRKTTKWTVMEDKE